MTAAAPAEPERGTFAALGNPKVIAHLKRMGVPAIELLPYGWIARLDRSG